MHYRKFSKKYSSKMANGLEYKSNYKYTFLNTEKYWLKKIKINSIKYSIHIQCSSYWIVIVCLQILWVCDKLKWFWKHLWVYHLTAARTDGCDLCGPASSYTLWAGLNFSILLTVNSWLKVITKMSCKS